MIKWENLCERSSVLSKVLDKSIYTIALLSCEDFKGYPDLLTCWQRLKWNGTCKDEGKVGCEREPILKSPEDSRRVLHLLCWLPPHMSASTPQPTSWCWRIPSYHGLQHGSIWITQSVPSPAAPQCHREKVYKNLVAFWISSLPPESGVVKDKLGSLCHRSLAHASYRSEPQERPPMVTNVLLLTCQPRLQLPLSTSLVLCWIHIIFSD